MSKIIPEKFPDTGINHLAADGDVYTPQQWPEAVDFVRNSIRRSREAAIDSIESVELSERQVFAMNGLAIPAVLDTVSDVLDTSERITAPGTPYVSLLAKQDFTEYHGTMDRRLAGIYYADRNQVVINQGNHVSDAPEDLAYFAKVFIHEHFHYLSDQFSSLDRARKHLQIQRVGVQALGEDIREKNRGELTWDYFVAFNEAVTEMLAIETYQKIAQDPVFKKHDGNPAVPFKSYPGYRHLADAVMEDARRYGATDLSKTNLLHYIARGYLTGDLKPLIQLARATYPGLSMREFGLITSADELPQESDFVWRPSDGGGDGGQRTLSEEYLMHLRDRLNGKPATDYVSDVPPPPSAPPSPAARAFFHEIRDHRKAKVQHEQLSYGPDSKLVDTSGDIIQRDENGNTVHYDQAWLRETLDLLIKVSQRFRRGEIDVTEATETMDQWLFDDQHISELSSGFEDFYVVKHCLLDSKTSKEDFDKLIKDAKRKMITLQDTQN